jgi:hypothetical protein
LILKKPQELKESTVDSEPFYSNASDDESPEEVGAQIKKQPKTISKMQISKDAVEKRDVKKGPKSIN